MTRIALANDYPLFLSSVSSMINTAPGVKVCASFTEPEKLVDWFDGANADVLVFDYRTPSFDGLNASKQILQKFPFASILLLSVTNEPEVAASLRLCGIRGWLSREAQSSHLLQAIETISTRSKSDKGHFPATRLSKREADIVVRLVAGKTTQEIGNELHLSPLTVKTHRQNLLRKFEVSNTAQLLGRINYGNIQF
jgi:DNA-binding NarL/FixJ family response regulator